MGIFKRIKELESDIWRLDNPPKFKSGDECTFKYSIEERWENIIYSDMPVFVLSEKCANQSRRIYYVSDSLPRDPIHVIEVNETMLTLIK